MKFEMIRALVPVSSMISENDEIVTVISLESLSTEEIEELFGCYGDVFGIKHDSKGQFSFINYTTVEAASDAFQAFHKKQIPQRYDFPLTFSLFMLN